jgi:DNA-binding XRE family transcriptional regulator
MSEKKTAMVPDNRVKSLRQELGLTQRELAHTSAVSTSTIRRIENGHARSRIDVEIRIANSLAATALQAAREAPSINDVFPNLLMANNQGSNGKFFALDNGPFGNPPELTIRGFSDSEDGVCGLPPFNTAAFNFTTTTQFCGSSRICKAN